ncbi:CGNR zinc finger domain-containing protein [Kitasatospora sp. NPDC059648]|uniref:CGNR zinc finger domain-containing protein n=1 Tax=Kitasatospora sp. NPDC059648 TaxID=3346894 RepID=UPI0036ABD5CC
MASTPGGSSAARVRAAAAVRGRAQYPPLIRVDDHDGEGSPHLHLAPNGEDAVTWLGRSCAAAPAHVVCGDPAVTIGHCHAADCERFYVDDSRNRTRRFCSNACASRTTVAAHRGRRKETS